MANQKVWFITGASKGLGLALAKELLSEGYKVAATSRKAEDLKKEISGNPDFLPLEVNLVDEDSVGAAIEQTVNYFGQVDVIVNNAGYGLGGAFEELTAAELHQNFDVNVFATLHVVKKALPYLRKQKSGHSAHKSVEGGMMILYNGK